MSEENKPPTLEEKIAALEDTIVRLNREIRLLESINADLRVTAEKRYKALRTLVEASAALGIYL